MRTKITFFPVDNGDMTLIQLADDERTSLLIDVKIRNAADEDGDDVYDVATALRKKLKVNHNHRPYVDGFMLSHPDLDHCSGLRKHFWLGKADNYEDDDLPLEERRILINELWFSPIVFQRKANIGALVPDAEAFFKEAKRRVDVNKAQISVNATDRIRIFGEAENGEADGLEHLVFPRDASFTGVNSQAASFMKGRVLGPFSAQETEDDEVTLSKNNSSIIINFELMPNMLSERGFNFLSGGDAEVAIWDKVADEYDEQALAYDLLLAPHHCSWRTMSHMSWSDYGEDVVVSPKARSALSHANVGAVIIASSKSISDEDSDPPCIRAQREYESILKGKDGLFRCTGQYPSVNRLEPISLEVKTAGFVLVVSGTAAEAITSERAPRAGADGK